MGPFDLVVSCVGMLSDLSIPTWAGTEVFQGPVFHTAEYRHDIDISGQRVALVGTGSTACQLAPRLAELAGQLDVYQREPAYVLPKKVRELHEGRAGPIPTVPSATQVRSVEAALRRESGGAGVPNDRPRTTADQGVSS